MLSTFYLDTSPPSSASNHSTPLHSCPFCRCKSLDASINIKISPRNSACNIRIAKDAIQNKIRNSKIYPQNQNVYYRTFQSPRKSGLSPNGNKKIVIQYVSPQSHSSNSTAFRPFAKPQPNNHTKTSFIVSSPRNIYTNENTPPKSKYLQKKSSRKNSQQKMNFLTPVQGLTLVDSENVRKTDLGEDAKLFVSFMRLGQDNTQRQIEQIQINRKVDYFERIPETQTKNFIKRLSGQDSSASPFHSLVDSSPQVAPYASALSSPMVDDKFQSVKKNLGPSIKEMIPWSQSSQNEPKMSKRGTEPFFEAQRLQLTPKSAESSPGGKSYSHQRFDKTLGKMRQKQRCQENELIYSESDKQTINNHGGSVRNLPELIQNKNRLADVFSRSEQNIRAVYEVKVENRQRNETMELSDNCSTPKSKYKGIKESSEGKKKSVVIKFYPLGENRKSKLSSVSQEDKKMGDEQKIGISGQKINNQDKKVSKQQTPSMERIETQRKGQLPIDQQSATKHVLGLQTPKPHSASAEQNGSQQMSSGSKGFAAELAEQLDLNYDYYFYKPIHNDSLYKVRDTGQGQFKRDSSLNQSAEIDVTF